LGLEAFREKVRGRGKRIVQFWTKPEELPFDPKKQLPALARTGTAGPWVLFADGSARQLPAKIKPETLRALITRAGGEVVNIDE